MPAALIMEYGLPLLRVHPPYNARMRMPAETKEAMLTIARDEGIRLT